MVVFTKNLELGNDWFYKWLVSDKINYWEYACAQQWDYNW